MSSNVALRYYLPKTVLAVGAQVRYLVAFDSVGGHLEPRVEVRVTPRVVPDRTARCCTTLDAAVLESASLGVQLTPEGLIESVGSHISGQPVSGGTGPTGRISSAGGVPTPESVAAVTADLARRTAWIRPGSLRLAFDRSHPRTAALIADLSARAEQFLAGMRMGDGPAEVEVFGSALAVVERELAAADRMRREWIAAQGFDLRSGQWEVDLSAAVQVSDPLPDHLPADTPLPAGLAQLLARDFGVLIAVVDPDRYEDADPATRGPQGLRQVDEILLRRPRPVTVAVYRRALASIGESSAASSADAGGSAADGSAADGSAAVESGSDREWVRDDILTQHLEAVDAHSTVDALGPEGHPGDGRALHLSLHPGGRCGRSASRHRPSWPVLR